MSKLKQGVVAAVSPIATRAELDQRIANRAKPRIERHLTIEGGQKTAVHQQIEAFSENRIKALKGRLNKARQKLEHDFRKSRLRGRPRIDFDRSR